MLLADPAPEDVVVRESLPTPAHLRCAAEGRGIEVSEDLQRDFAGENGEGVDPDEMGELFAEQRELDSRERENKAAEP